MNRHWQLLLEPTWWLHYFPLGKPLTGVLAEVLSVVIGLSLVVSGKDFVSTILR